MNQKKKKANGSKCHSICVGENLPKDNTNSNFFLKIPFCFIEGLPYFALFVLKMHHHIYIYQLFF
jgi:hypothetical protein